MDEGYNTFENEKLKELLDKNNNPDLALVTESHEMNLKPPPDSSDLTSVSSNLPTHDDEEDLQTRADEVKMHNDEKDDLSDITSISTNDSSSSSNEDKKKKFKVKSRKLKEVLKITRKELLDAKEKIQGLDKHLKEEADAKERLESSLSKLKTRHQDQLKDEEALRSRIAHKDDYCTNLERKTASLEQQLTVMRSKLSGETDDDNSNLTDMIDNNELQEKLTSNELLVRTYIEQIQKLDMENTDLKAKLEKIQESKEQNDKNSSQDLNVVELQNKIVVLEQRNKELEQRLEEGRQKEEETEVSKAFRSISDSNLDDDDDDEERRNFVQKRIKIMEDNLDELQVKIESLETDNETLQKQLAEEQIKFKDTLQSNQQTHDSLIDSYKNEVSTLQDRVRLSEESNNDNLIKTLRQDVLDLQLANERLKQSHRVELEESAKKVKEKHEFFEKLEQETSNLKEEISNTQEQLRSSDNLANERMQKITELKTEIVSLNDSIKLLKDRSTEKDEEISDLTIKLDTSTDMVTKLYEEQKSLKEEVKEMEGLQQENKNLVENLDATKQKLKLKSMKMKFLKKQMKELMEQKQKAESIMFVLPEMQKKLDHLEDEKLTLQENIQTLQRREEERMERMEKEKQEEEERIQKERAAWERNLLGIGKCELYHEGEETMNHENDILDPFNRPNSAPLMKPRPPSARRYNLTNGGQRNAFTKRAPTLNPTALNSYPEGRRASEKMREHQSRIILSNKNKKNLYRSVTAPSGKLLNSFNHSSGNKHFPKIQRQHMEGKNAPPRVLVWGDSDDGPGKKLVAVGDYVLVRIKRDCSLHGETANEYTGYIKYIGFIEGNMTDVYIGLRLDDAVGNTDGRVDGRRYFRCEAKRGKFVHLDDIVQVLESKVSMQ